MDQEPPLIKTADNITVILHRPGIPENIGSAARVISNTGFSRMIISCAETEDWQTAEKLAVSAGNLLKQAPKVGSLKEAITLSGARFVVGTTARDRKYWDHESITTSAPEILRRAEEVGVAILFGPESYGLSNEDLTLCHMRITLPSAGEFSSYNLSHAVAIVLFMLMTTDTPTPDQLARAPAPLEQAEGMYDHIQELLTEIEFLWEDNPDHMMRAVRNFINRAEPDESEVRMIRGICRRMLWNFRNNNKS